LRWWWFVIVVLGVVDILGVRAFFIPIVGCGYFFIDFSF